ncbi:MAG: MFS transporter [Betaproteobacteria bacterium]|nr:MFS transporter [Betaproteobacteria bacterium]
MSSVLAGSVRFDVKIISLVGGAHLFSHFFQLVIPTLFPLLKEEFHTGYAGLGLAITLFYVVSGVLQTPAGFAVDRFGGKAVLASGLGFVGLGLIVVASAPTYWVFVLGAMIFGIGNAVFHPADYSILNARVSPARLGHAFSVHGIGGNLGWAMAPPFAIAISSVWGWRTAVFSAGVIGVVAALVIASQRILAVESDAAAARAREQKTSLRADFKVLTAMPVLMCFTFFCFSAAGMVALQTFATTALMAVYGVPLLAASTALTGFLLGGAAGILTGGFVSTRSSRQGLITAVGISSTAVLMILLGTGSLATGLLIVVMTLAGFCSGSVGPARDIIVREVTPAHARGKVYGFVYSGMELGAAVSPTLFGWLIDIGHPNYLFFGAAIALVLSLATLSEIRRRGPVAA